MITWITDRISANLAFFPPSPASYSVINHGDRDRELYIQPLQEGIKKVPSAKVVQLKVKKRSDESIVAAFVPAQCLPPTQHTILCSHGNAVDLGQMLPFYEYMSRKLTVNIVGYDYRGYGKSDGTPTVSATLDDISTVLQYLKTEHKIDEKSIILYGQSIGSGPTSWLAAKTPNVAGVVFHSAFLSAMRVVLRPDLKFWPYFADIYPNIKYVKKIQSRLLIMHGCNDDVVEVEHGKALHSLCRNASEPFFPEGIGHHDLQSHPLFIPTMKRFLKECFGDRAL